MKRRHAERRPDHETGGDGDAVEERMTPRPKSAR
jgi:hypothetical protein